MQATFPLPEGDVVVRIPNDISAESLAEVEALFGLLVRTIRRPVLDREQRIAILNAEAVGDGSCDPGFGVNVGPDGVVSSSVYNKTVGPVWMYFGHGESPYVGKHVKASKIASIDDGDSALLESGDRFPVSGCNTVIPGDNAIRTPVQVGDYGVMVAKGDVMFYNATYFESMYRRD